MNDTLREWRLRAWLVAAAIAAFATLSAQGAAVRTDNNVAVRMRDGVVLRADVYRPEGVGPFPVLVYRTPYGKHDAAQDYHTHLEAVKRGYVVVLQDVRGRYASDGIFTAYRNEGADGYDTIEWAARQPWSNGKVGTYGLSYPGAVQWLAAMEQPPHLVAMGPAMTFSSPRNFFYMNGVFDLSWLPWIYVNVAPDARVRLGLPGIRDSSEAAKAWPQVAQEYRSFLPLRDMPHLRAEAPYYFEWLAHPPEDAWWNWAELRGRYSRVSAAVLNLSGWYDEAYGPEGAVTNFNGLRQARASSGQAARTHLMLGPWAHGVASTEARLTGDVDFGPSAAIDYDDVVLDFLDHYVRGVDNEFARAPPVRHFMMGANEWHEESQWPPAAAKTVTLYLAAQGNTRRLDTRRSAGESARSELLADPRDPVSDPHDEFGPHDYSQLHERSRPRQDLLTFDTEPLEHDWPISGAIAAEVSVSCDCRDFDLWVRLLDVRPDGRAFNLMSPGNDVLRASYRAGGARQLLEPGRAYQLRLPNLYTSIRLAKGHRLRAQISASFAPHLSRNLQTGESEVSGSESRTARITVHHDATHVSQLLVPVLKEPLRH